MRLEAPPRGTIMRATTVMLDRDRVIAAWRDSGFPEDAAFSTAPGDRGTVVTVTIPHAAPTTALGSAFETLMRKNPADAVEKALMRFKAKLEAGEAPSTEGQPTGERS
jgi:uncharacterized membrane protein